MHAAAGKEVAAAGQAGLGHPGGNRNPGWVGEFKPNFPASGVLHDHDASKLGTVDPMTARSRQVGTFPWSGRRGPEYDRETVREVFEGPYRTIYQINEAQMDVMVVIHGARERRDPPAHTRLAGCEPDKLGV